MNKTLKAYWHIHHMELWDFARGGPIEWRIDYIKGHKPKKEIPRRLRLLKEIKGEVPEKVVKAFLAFSKIGRAYNKAWRGPRKMTTRFRDSYWKSQAAFEKARQKANGYMEQLHKAECKRCTWDGRTIFPDRTLPPPAFTIFTTFGAKKPGSKP
jgi:hypothetical protein